MQASLLLYPEIPWQAGWPLSSGPADTEPFQTASPEGSVCRPGQSWKLQLSAPHLAGQIRLFSDGLLIRARRRPERNWIHTFVTNPGILCGAFAGQSTPVLETSGELHSENHIHWTRDGDHTVLLLCREQRFALVCGPFTTELAFEKAEDALEIPFETLSQDETKEREAICRLFSVNPRHNPPVALAAETLATRLRDRNGSLHGIWSVADGFDTETFSLNELYPLVRAWSLADPGIAVDLVHTALALQQSSGGFPAWADSGGRIAATAPWPLIIRSFETAWQTVRDPLMLRKQLPALRKYILWALRRFDPHRDRIPAWQNEQEAFVPGNYARGKATPELTVFLITELDALIRLCSENDPAEAAIQTLTDERDHLIRTLNTIFWNQTWKDFSNVWKDGHYLHEPSFASFTPLCWSGLDPEKQKALIERFDAIHAFPGQKMVSAWDHEAIDEASRLPAIHQFMAFDALNTVSARGAMMLFAHRAREGFAAWFDRESLAAVRKKPDATAYALGPVTAALILTVQAAAEGEAARSPALSRKFLKGFHGFKFTRTDVRIASVFLLGILIIHLAYNIPRSHDHSTGIAEAVLNYKQGRLADALRICRRYPDHPSSMLIQANLLMLAEKPDQAESIYRQTLIRETESPSALLGLALALQMNGNFSQAAKRYADFIDIHESAYPEAAFLAEEFMQLCREQFAKPPRWRRIFNLPMMGDLGI